MNVEMFFVKTDDRQAVIASIKKRLQSVADPQAQQPNWRLESSYDVLVAPDPKRKIAVSPVNEGWIAAIESKEVLDFALLQQISEETGSEVIACQLAGAIDSCGYARCCGGHLEETKWLENDPDPLGALRRYLRERDVPYDLMTFREAVQLRDAGWNIIQKS